MGAAKRITQETFDEAVKANVDDFDMEAAEAVQAAVEEFEIQKVDLTGINKTFYGDRKEHPVLAEISKLEAAVEGLSEAKEQESIELSGALEQISRLVGDKDLGSEANAEALALTSQKGVVPVLLKAMEVTAGNDVSTIACLKTLATLLANDPNREAFHKQSGTKQMTSILSQTTSGPLAAAVLSTSAQACFKNEDNKASFVACGGDVLILAALREPGAEEATIMAACTALRSITVADDDRPCLTSNAFKTAREICGKGAHLDLLKVLRSAQTGASALAAAACSALRRVSVTDEICKEIADHGGIELLLRVVKTYADSASVTRTSLSVVRQLANSDANKNLIIQHGGLDAVKVVSKAHIPGSCEQALGLLVGLTLRNPEGANAVVGSSCIETIADVMSALPGEQWVQRQGCMAVRNVVSRNPEHKQAFLDKGLEALLRSAQKNHAMACKDVGGAALRDLGIDDYDLGLVENAD